MAVKCFEYNTRESTDGRPVTFDLDDAGTTGQIFFMSCKQANYGSAQVVVRSGTANAFVLTVVVSNDGRNFVAHPTAATLTASAFISPPINLTGYAFFGLKLTTVNTGDCMADLFLVCKDTPA